MSKGPNQTDRVDATMAERLKAADLKLQGFAVFAQNAILEYERRIALLRGWLLQDPPTLSALSRSMKEKAEAADDVDGQGASGGSSR